MLWFYLLRYAWHRRWIWLVFDDGGYARVQPRASWPGWVVYTAPSRPGSLDLETSLIRTSTIVAMMEEYLQGEASRLQAIFDGDAENEPVGAVMLGDGDEDEDDDGDGDVLSNS